MSSNCQANRLLEADIKALVLNKLRGQGLIDPSSIIMSELTVGNFSRRVDLAVYANSRLLGFEIKSEADSLSRVNGQINKYLEYFDKVIVVTDKKFTSKLSETLPEAVGLWELSGPENLKVIHGGKYQKRIDKSKLIDLMDTVDMAKLATKLSIKSEKNRRELTQSLLNKSYKNLREGVQQSLSRKFHERTKVFIECTEPRSITKEDIKLLSRFSVVREAEKTKTAQAKIFWDNIEQHMHELKKFMESATRQI